MPKDVEIDSGDFYSSFENHHQVPSPWTKWTTKLKWNGGHQLLPTTDSPTISACTTSTNLSNLDFQSNSTINNFKVNIRTTIPEIEPLQQTKIDMDTNSSKKQDLVNSEEQLCESESSEKQRNQSPYRFKQVIAAIFVSWVSMVIGYVSGYTSPAEIDLKRDLNISDYKFSLMSGAMPLAAMLGGLSGGPCIEKFGRKSTILFTDIFFLVGWLFNYFAREYWYLLVSRIVAGYAVGIASLTLPVYLGETIQPEVRGTLGLLPTAFGNVGILLCFSAGFFLKWANIALVGALLTIPFLLLFWVIPETPRWYVSKGEDKKALEALKWLRGKDNLEAVNKEYEELLKTEKLPSKNDDKSDFWELFSPSHRKSFVIVLGLMFFQQMSGINAVIFYTTQIFEDTGSNIEPGIQTIIVGAVNFLATFIATILIDRLGRKILLYISSVAMIITLAVLGVYFYIFKMQQQINLEAYSWVPLASFVIYVLGFSFGFGPVPWLMMGEILPAKIRGLAASVSTAFNWGCTFAVTATFPLFKDVIGEYGAFWLFCGFVVIGLVFTILVVPETKGQSLEDIERSLAGVKVRRMSSIANMKPLQSGL